MYRSFTVSYGQSLNFLLRVFYYLSVVLLPSCWFLQWCVYVRFNFLVVALRFKLAIFSLWFYCLLYSLYTINTSPFARLCNLELFVSQLVYSTLKFLRERWNSTILCIPFYERAKFLIRSNTTKQIRNQSS